MRDFTKVAPVLWQSRRFQGLPSDEARLAYLYLLTCPQGSSAGCFYLSPAYALADLQWTPEQWQAAVAALLAADMLATDPEHDVVLIKRWFKHNPPMNPKHLTGIERILERLPSDILRQEALDAARAAMTKRVDDVLTDRGAAQIPLRLGLPRPNYG